MVPCGARSSFRFVLFPKTELTSERLRNAWQTRWSTSPVFVLFSAGTGDPIPPPWGRGVPVQNPVPFFCGWSALPTLLDGFPQHARASPITTSQTKLKEAQVCDNPQSAAGERPDLFCPVRDKFGGSGSLGQLQLQLRASLEASSLLLGSQHSTSDCCLRASPLVGAGGRQLAE